MHTKKMAAPKVDHSNTHSHINSLELAAKVQRVKNTTKSRQAHRLIDYLITNGPSQTGSVARDCAIGNVSHAANFLRPALRKEGLDIVAIRPKTALKNQFGEPSGAHIWSLRTWGKVCQ